jgi:hypothetical protein
MILILWCIFAGAVLIGSVVAHVSTFLGVDLMAVLPGLVTFQFLWSAPVVAAGWYSNKAAGGATGRMVWLRRSVAPWMYRFMQLLIVYVIINIVMLVGQTWHGRPEEQNGKYVLSSHGSIVREITEEEYHQHRVFIARGASGAWMCLFGMALIFLVGVVRSRSQPAG